MAECHVSVFGSLWHWPNFKNNCFNSILHILFDGGVPNLVYDADMLRTIYRSL